MDFAKEKHFSVEGILGSCSVTHSCPTLCKPMNTSDFLVLHYLPEFAHTHVHWVGDAIQPSHPLLPPSPPAFNRLIRIFSNELALRIRWPKYWNFSFSISPSNEQSGLISFRIEWFDILAVHRTLKCLLQHHIWKALGRKIFNCMLGNTEKSY